MAKLARFLKSLGMFGGISHIWARAVRPLCKPSRRKAPFYLRCNYRSSTLALADTSVSGRATEFCYFETR